MTEPEHQSEKYQAADFRLLLERLEESILHGTDTDKVSATLKREDLRTKMTAADRLKLARLAQMAGEVETALLIIDEVNRNHPEKANAWEQHLELLHILNRRQALAAVLATAKGHIPPDAYEGWMQRLGSATPGNSDEDIISAKTPFDDFRRREAQLQKYLSLFSGREDCFARQWVDRKENRQGYVPVHRPLEIADVEDHLKGRRTYGIYLMHSDATVKLAVLDVDLKPEYRNKQLKKDQKDVLRREIHYLFTHVQELSREAGIEPLAEFSGSKGYHFWYFLKHRIPPASTRSLLAAIAAALNPDLTSLSIEVFPKQDRPTGQGLGNLVKLPLGIHRLTGKPSYFVACPTRTREAQLAFLENVVPADPDRLIVSGDSPKDAELIVHPRFKDWAREYPELFVLEHKCIPLAQIIATCRAGKPISFREEKILLQTLGFLPKGNKLIHHLLSSQPEYNPHMVDYKLSRLRGSPLGCRRIHSLLQFGGDFCRFDKPARYDHPLLNLEEWKEEDAIKAEKVENLTSALENLKNALFLVEKYLK
jgi:hypothetical protein